jgi:ribonuclease Z
MQMKRSWKFAVLGGLAVAAAGVLAYTQRVAIGLHLMTREVAAVASVADPLAALPDGLHVGLCGAGSPLPDEKRGGPCTTVVAGRKMFVFDAGSSASRHIVQMRLNVGQIDGLFLTHYHSDHIDGVGELLLQRWVQRTSTTPLPVYGPAGLEQVLQGFGQVYTQDRAWRIAHHGEEVLPPAGFGAQARPFDMPPGGRKVLVSEPDLEIVAFAVEHEPVSAAVGYRIRYKDRTVVISGDTRRCAAVERESRGADLLLHEALSPAMSAIFERQLGAANRGPLAKVFRDILTYHTSPEEAAQIAQSAGVRMLVLHHIIPLLPPGLEPAFLERSAEFFRGPIHIGQDGDWISLPAGRTAITVGRRP